MKKRQTVSQPGVKKLQYSVLKQNGDNNDYELTGREKLEDGTIGEIIHIFGTDEKINEYAGEEIVGITQAEKERRKMNKCAAKIQEAFLKFKEKNPFKREINVYLDKEIKDSIKSILEGVTGDAVIKVLDGKLKKTLADYGLTFSRPASDYFTNENIPGTAWLNVRFIEKDTIREETINKRATECAKKIHEVFLRLQKQDPKKININIYNDKEGKEAITNLLDGTETYHGIDDTIYLFDALKKELDNQGLTFSRPAYDYFINKNLSGGWISISQKEATKEIAA